MKRVIAISGVLISIFLGLLLVTYSRSWQYGSGWSEILFSSFIIATRDSINFSCSRSRNAS